MTHITEPVRKSALDVVQYNLRAVGYRMEDIIQDLCMDYNNIPITGLFLVYPTCYVHVLEAWEDVIYKHYELLYTTDDSECKFGKAIPLPSYHHVHQRFFSGWCHVYMIPPTLIGTPVEARTLDEIQKQVSNCLIKVYALCEYIANAVHKKSIDVQDALENLKDKARYLPENTVLESLLNVNLPVLKTVEEYLRLYSDVSPSVFWDGKNYTYIQ
ncbi:hypothetical protein P5V15_002274 [Pogonomyrmex californicus]